MQTYHKSQSRTDCLFSEGPAGQGHLGSSRSLGCVPEQLASMCMSCHKESAELCPSTSHQDWHCPVCLQTASFPVQTSCGHLFCAPCLIAYWRHGSWLDAISCPLCRQKVTDYLCDAPLLLQLLARGLSTIGGLVWLFFFRVALCCVGTVVSISSPPLDPVSTSSASPLETEPSLCGLLGVLDDVVVVILLLICVININQQMVSERGGHSANTTTSQGVTGNPL
ncbi:RING-HC_RNF170 domain-containing protein isoform X3 [Scophthalmus maximus]|uniref:RING-HC_RNF170 domain-containing protein isoform X3 n=1 Tax=Scophthalmus maximus TaxID=52904 RepID=UPI001FA82AEC|nr:RING-HC_RNF170 domain-containing protein isoform X3 [Scophthalmus maximus]